MRRILLVLVVGAVAVSAPRGVEAFCGFYVAGAEDDLFNNATTVALMRDGTRTVLSMQNNYQGPPQDFAMVVPVPVVLQKKNVKTLPAAIFDRLDKLAAPRLVEYWEQDPCPPDAGPVPEPMALGTIGAGAGTGSGFGRGEGSVRPKVVVEAQFTVGEYEIVILSAEEATALETWLTGNGYKIPDGAAKHLEPYVAGGMKFFVAKVDIEKVTMNNGMAKLSPLRFHYDTDEFSLPIRLGLINSAGTQDLLVHIVAPSTRYEVANYDNVQIPTNLIVQNEVRDRFGEFYAALFDATLEKNPGAVVTEYAWSAGSCDPCPESPLTDSELYTLGLDVLYDDDGKEAPLLEPVLRAADPKIDGKMDKNILRRYVRRNFGRLRNCPAQGKGGALTVSFEIGNGGKVSNAKVNGDGGDAFHSCVAGVFTAMRLPDKMAAKVRFPFTFTTRPVASRRAGGFVLTRLHARYAKDAIGDDLVFRKADPINGGTGGATPDKSSLGTLSGSGRGPSSSGILGGGSMSTFQGRYIIRHEWAGKMECESPRRGVWGRPPPGVEGDASPKAAQDLAFVARGGVTLTSMLAQPPPPEIAVDKGEPVAEDSADKEPAKAEPPETEKKGGGSCSCRAGGGTDGGLWGLIALLLVWRRPSTARAALRSTRSR